MRASAVPICCPISARMMLTVTAPSRSMLYQMVGWKPSCTVSAVAPRRTNPNIRLAPAMPTRKPRRDGRCRRSAIRLLPKRGRRPLDSLADAEIGHAAAEVAGHDSVDVLIARRWKILKEGRRLHDLAGLAVTALRHLEL